MRFLEWCPLTKRIPHTSFSSYVLQQAPWSGVEARLRHKRVSLVLMNNVNRSPDTFMKTIWIKALQPTSRDGGQPGSTARCSMASQDVLLYNAILYRAVLCQTARRPRKESNAVDTDSTSAFSTATAITDKNPDINAQTRNRACQTPTITMKIQPQALRDWPELRTSQ